jgi:hypothetical protein
MTSHSNAVLPLPPPPPRLGRGRDDLRVLESSWSSSSSSLSVAAALRPLARDLAADGGALRRFPALLERASLSPSLSSSVVSTGTAFLADALCGGGKRVLWGGVLCVACCVRVRVRLKRERVEASPRVRAHTEREKARARAYSNPLCSRLHKGAVPD